MGVLQATSTQNDYVASLWLVGLAYLVLLSKVRSLDRVELLALAVALGLGTLTKGTFYVYAAPFMLWFFLPRLRRTELPRTLLEGAVILVVVTLLNLGFWGRNLATFGSPLGPDRWVQGRLEVRFGIAAWTTALAEQLTLNLATPSEGVNDLIVEGVRGLYGLFGEESEAFQLTWFWNHEDLAGNPLHLMLVAVAVLALVFLPRLDQKSLTKRFTLVLLSTFLVLSFVVTFDLYGVRYQLPFFVMGAPLIGVVLGDALSQRPSFSAALSSFLIVAALPWLLLNATRPVIGWQPRTKSEGVFEATPADLLFANWRFRRDSYLLVTEAIRESECRNVGLRLDSHDLEYPIWWLLEAPQSGVRIEALADKPHLDRYSDESFRPCAIICAICGDQTRLNGLERQVWKDGVTLYTGEGYTPDIEG